MAKKKTSKKSTTKKTGKKTGKKVSKKKTSGSSATISFRSRIWRNLSRDAAERKIVEIQQDALYVDHKLLVQGGGKFTVIGIFRRS